MRRTFVALLAVAIVGLVWAPSALATTCSHDGAPFSDVIVEVSSGHDVSIDVTTGGAFVVSDITSSTGFECGGPDGIGTVDNSAFLFIDGAAGNETVQLDDGGPGGRLTGRASLEIDVDLLGGTADRLDLLGTPAHDDYLFDRDSSAEFRIGSSTGSPRVFVNGTENVQAEGTGGDDLLQARATNSGTNLAFNIPITLDGGDGNDTINGGASGDVLQGDFGNDTLRGNGGNDIITGGPDNDTYITPALDGADTFQGSSGIDTVDYTGRTAGVVVDETTLGGDGQSGENDSIASDVDNITGGAGNDQLVGSGLPNVIHGAGGNDTITGGLNNDTLDGGANNDIFLTPTNDGADVYTGGTGVDTITYASRPANVTVSLPLGAGDGQAGENDSVSSDMEDVIGGNGNDTLIGTSASKLLGNGINTLNGGPGNDTITGAGANDTLIGGPDNDTFRMGTTADGADVIDGGPGVDLADYSQRTADLTITLASGADDGAAGEGDNLVNIDNVNTGSGNDHVTGNILANTINLNDGNDTVSSPTLDGADLIEGGAGVDTMDYSLRSVGLFVLLDTVANDGQPGEDDNVLPDVEVVLGGSGSDRLIGGNGPNTLSGGGGNDFLEGGAGADTIMGGPGTDQVEYTQDANVTVTLDGVANDGFGGGSEGDNADADGSVENVLGSPGDDVITGNALNNTITGSTGNDVLNGGAGNDTFVSSLTTVSDGADTIIGGPDIDTMSYASRTANVTVTLNGSADDGLSGEGDNVQATVENVVGGFGADKLTGSSLNNTLTGGPGNDTLAGKGGADTFLMRDGSSDSAAGGGGTDSAQVDAGGIDTTTSVEVFIP